MTNNHYWPQAISRKMDFTPMEHTIRRLRLWLGLIIMTCGSLALAHHPHDMIDVLAVSPTYESDHTLYFSNLTHLFKSENGGHSWKELVNGLDHTHPISSIVILPSPAGSDTLFISTLGDGIYRSSDAGASWSRISNGLQDLRIRGLHSGDSNGRLLAIDAEAQLYNSDDGGNSWQLSNVPAGTLVSAISAPVPGLDGLLLAGDNTGRVYRSSDSGATWQPAGGLPSPSEITVIALDPSDLSGSSYFVGTRNKGLLHTSDAGVSFQAPSGGFPTDHVVELEFSRSFAQDHLMIATTWHEAIFLSSDAGKTWTKYAEGLSTDEQADTPKYRSPYFRQVKIVSADNQTLFLAAFTGLFKSTDGGQTWVELETLPVNLIKGLAVSPATGGTHSVGITTYGGGAYISDDEGVSWLIANRGLNTTRLMDIAFSPSYAQDRTVFSGSIGLLLKSTDGGDSWEQIRLDYNPLRKRIVNKLINLGLPERIGKRYLKRSDFQPVYPTLIAPSPNYAEDSTVLFGTRYHGMYRSDEGGHNAYNVWEHTDGPVTALALSPNFANDHTAFIYVRGDSIYKSTDGGDSWREVITEFVSTSDDGSDADDGHASGDYVLVFSPAYGKDHTLFSAGPLGLFKSTDQGEHWDALTSGLPAPAANVLALAVSPDYATDGTLLVSVKGLGMYKSIDGGQTFSAVAGTLIAENQSLELIEFSQGSSPQNTVYAASDETLFCSTDKGDSWKALQRPVRYEDRRDVVRYIGDWAEEEDPRFSASTVHYAENPGARAELNYFGCGIRWIGTRSPAGGAATVYVDAQNVGSVDLHSAKTERVSNLFQMTGLPCGAHNIAIEVADTNSADSNINRRVTLDAFDVLPPQ